MNLERIDISVVVEGVAVQQRHPHIAITVDSTIVFDGAVIDTQQFDYHSTAVAGQTMCVIDIEYYNKSDNDTIVDDQGNIIANQSILIKEIWINGVDIIKTGAIHQNIGHYTMTLPVHKYQYFVDNGISTSPTTNTHMFENGVWHLELDLPLLSTLTAKHNFVEPWEQFDVSTLVGSIATQLELCKTLEKEIKGNNQTCSNNNIQ